MSAGNQKPAAENTVSAKADFGGNKFTNFLSSAFVVATTVGTVGLAVSAGAAPLTAVLA